MTKLFISLPLIFFLGCTTLTSKVEESNKINESALKQGAAVSPEEVAKKFANQCHSPKDLKWKITLDKSDPLLQQDVGKGKFAYGPYEVICFSFAETGEKALQFSTSHQGGGYNKAYYVLPAFYMFTRNLRPVQISRELNLKQEPWSGDYQGQLLFKHAAGETYILVVESNNRHPDIPWDEYSNRGLGWAIRGLFPVKIYSSPFGKITAEIKTP